MLNPAFYGTLKDFWYTSQNHSIPLLRAENAVRTPWVVKQVTRYFWKSATIVDIGCGAGWLSNSLALHGYDIIGVDDSTPNLKLAQRYDATRRVRYVASKPTQLPIPDASVDVVCAMDILEHVNDPYQINSGSAACIKAPRIILISHLQ